ncbi:MAG: HEPN domain-containing protein [Polyangiaceae bacterium]
MKPDPKKMVPGYLTAAEEAARGAQLLAEQGNRYGAYLLSQSLEQIAKAVRVHQGEYPTLSHSIEQLVSGLPNPEPWSTRLLGLRELNKYATSFRYPTTGGRLDPGPSADKVTEYVQKLTALIELARKELLV